MSCRKGGGGSAMKVMWVQVPPPAPHKLRPAKELRQALGWPALFLSRRPVRVMHKLMRKFLAYPSVMAFPTKSRDLIELDDSNVESNPD